MAQTTHGFILERSEAVREVGGTVDTYTHVKSGAKLVHVNNDEREKTFGITFRTGVEDGTGVAHIIEHSVLCGSRKFPVKDPFVELIKTSLNSFLNAFTSLDFTMYPFASVNDRDFLNLMDVYLDASLHPLIHEQPLTLMQEGWHYEQNEDGELIYNGVVYNEMKGAYSSPDRVMDDEVFAALFDNCYRTSSGGAPAEIPTLTQKAFTDFHRERYHPSNSLIFLYGAVKLDEVFELIASYLDEYDANDKQFFVPRQRPFDKPVYVEKEYDIAPTDDPKTKTNIAFSWVVGDGEDTELTQGMRVLDRILVESDASPIKLKLLQSGLVQNVSSFFENSLRQSVFVIQAKGCDENNADKIKSIVFDALRELARDGIDKELALASVCASEFVLRENNLEGGLPKGIVANLFAVNGWNYGGDVAQQLKYEDIFKKIRAELDDGYFEKLLADKLLNNNHAAIVMLRPRAGLAAERDEELKRELAEFKRSLSEEQLGQIVEKTRELKELQATPDTPEALKCIPVLGLADIDRAIQDKPLKKLADNAVEFETASGGIAYLKLCFDTSVLADDELYVLGLLRALLGKLSTKTTNYVELSNKLMTYTGGIACSSRAYADVTSLDAFSGCFEVDVKTTLDNVADGARLVREILSSTDFSDADRIKQLLQALNEQLTVALGSAGHQYALRRARSYLSGEGAYTEKVEGIEFVRSISEFLKLLARDPNAARKQLETVTDKLFRRDNVEFCMTGSRAELDAMSAATPIILDGLRSGLLPAGKRDFALEAKNEAFIIPSTVNYVALAANCKQLGFEVDGTLKVAKTIVGKDYLWNRIRVLGGAYGALSALLDSGLMGFVSYRDPNVSKTYENYAQIAQYLRELELEPDALEGYVIGAVGELDAPLPPADEGAAAFARYKMNVTPELRQKQRDEIFAVRADDIRACARIYDAVEKTHVIAAVGGAKLEEEKSLFGSVQPAI